ncbi:hypothetical protein Syun_017135 [Stephania yunnanensis]|uniref:Uncharacterized protein n=1 Tax=Stephania yunnanensis TaxID=152371 RepID=A0AAP0J6G7_9MAGN
MWGRDEGDGRLGLGAGRGPNEGGGLRNLTPKLVHCLHLLHLFLVAGFSQWQSQKMESFGIGEVCLYEVKYYLKHNQLYITSEHFIFFYFHLEQFLLLLL